MKFIHLSDLHLGKKVNGFSMIEDQEYILERIIKIVEVEEAKAVVIAGDVYDKSVPTTEAVDILDNFLFQLNELKIEVLLIGGNHDSVPRLAFGGRIMAAGGIRIAPTYDGNVRPVTLTDEYGSVNFYLLPFIRPAKVRSCFPEEKIETYTDAVSVAIDNMKVDEAGRNVLVAHQFVTGAATSDSEEVSVGGLDNVDGHVFAPFDYVALGHLHRPQNVMNEKIRYAGSPLKYSFSEVNGSKSVTVVELKAKGILSVRTVDLAPRRDMKEIRGKYMDIMDRDFYKNENRDNYFRITLTDEEDVVDAMGRLRTVYPNLMKLNYDKGRNGGALDALEEEVAVELTPTQWVEAFFAKCNGGPMSPKQKEFAENLIKEVWEDEYK